MVGVEGLEPAADRGGAEYVSKGRVEEGSPPQSRGGTGDGRAVHLGLLSPGGVKPDEGDDDGVADASDPPCGPR